jgi:hypothetical protein
MYVLCAGKTAECNPITSKRMPWPGSFDKYFSLQYEIAFFNRKALKIKKTKEKVIKQQVFNSVWNSRTENKKKRPIE